MRTIFGGIIASIIALQNGITSATPSTCADLESIYINNKCCTSDASKAVEVCDACPDADATVSCVKRNVIIHGAMVGTDSAIITHALNQANEAQSTKITYYGSNNFENEFTDSIGTSGAPDMGLFPQPGLLLELDTKPIDAIIDVDEYLAAHSQYLLDIASKDGKLYGAFQHLNLKSQFWYKPSVFESHGYQVPHTWDELIALADTIVASGKTPFCMGIESGGATGWMITDLLEDILLRTGQGVVTYDQYAALQLSFNSTIFREAVRLASQIIHTPGYVAGGSAAILSTFFGVAQLPLHAADPGCFMHHGASFLIGFNAASGIGVEDVSTFPFPAIDPTLPSNVALGGGDILGLTNDDADTSDALRKMVDVSFIESKMSSQGIFGTEVLLFANTKTNLTLHGTDLLRGMATKLRTAVQTNSFRYDASDLMSFCIQGNLWKELSSFVADPSYAETLFANMEALRLSDDPCPAAACEKGRTNKYGLACADVALMGYCEYVEPGLFPDLGIDSNKIACPVSCGYSERTDMNKYGLSCGNVAGMGYCAYTETGLWSDTDSNAIACPVSCC